MNADDAARKIKEFRDEDLVRIAFSKEEEGYFPEMIVAAKAELATRNISPEEVENAKADGEKASEYSGREYMEPLSNGVWIAFAIFGMLFLFSLSAVAILYFSGYKTKAKQALGAIFFGVVMWAALGWLLVWIF